jgi:hypothetical protein
MMITPAHPPRAGYAGSITVNFTEERKTMTMTESLILEQQPNWGWEIIITERAKCTARAMAAEMRRNLEDATPEELGWPHLTPDELVASEWRCWFQEELAIYRKHGLLPD